MGFTSFGDTRRLEADLKAAGTGPVYLFGRVKEFNGMPWMSGVEVVTTQWIGKVRPVYPGKPHVITQSTVRGRVQSLLTPENIRAAADYLCEQAGLGRTSDVLIKVLGRASDIESLILQAHRPNTVESGVAAQAALERLAAYITASELDRIRLRPQSKYEYKSFAIGKHSQALPIVLTAEQRTAIQAIASDLARNEARHRILNVDVGTGKTAVYATGVAAVHDAGGRTAILIPNETLARQVAREMATWWPDLDLALITGSSGNMSVPPDSVRLLIGTTALLSREVGEFDLIVVDELHKFSREQCEKLVGSGAHLLEVSATPIPRSQALIKYGVIRQSRLTKAHTARHIETRLWQPDERKTLYASLRETVKRGDSLPVIYPRRSVELTNAPRELRRAAEIAYRQWSGDFPG